MTAAHRQGVSSYQNPSPVTPIRRPSGARDGGQFAPQERPESVLTLVTGTGTTQFTPQSLLEALQAQGRSEATAHTFVAALVIAEKAEELTTLARGQFTFGRHEEAAIGLIAGRLMVGASTKMLDLDDNAAAARVLIAATAANLRQRIPGSYATHNQVVDAHRALDEADALLAVVAPAGESAD